MTLAAVLLAGFVLGMRHATDPDHVVAVSTIVTRFRSVTRAAAVGALWGVGHSATILLVGGAIVLFGITIPPRLGLAMELAVAAMLIVLGALNLFGRPPRNDASFAPARPMAIGFVHGLAGSAAIALLVLTAIGDPRWSAAYLIVFGAGTVAGMMLVTTAMAVPLRVGASRLPWLARHLRLAAGVCSVSFGLFLAHQIGVVDGLFAVAPTWSPR